MKIAIDASALLAAYFPDEKYHDHAQSIILKYARGDIDLFAPVLVKYEIISACLTAWRRGRVEKKIAMAALNEMISLDINCISVGDSAVSIMDVADKYGVSAYDAAYLHVATCEKIPLITGDDKLFRTVEKKISWVKTLDNVKILK